MAKVKSTFSIWFLTFCTLDIMGSLTFGLLHLQYCYLSCLDCHSFVLGIVPVIKIVVIYEVVMLFVYMNNYTTERWYTVTVHLQLPTNSTGSRSLSSLSLTVYLSS